jgi:hypothetical protein
MAIALGMGLTTGCGPRADWTLDAYNIQTDTEIGVRLRTGDEAREWTLRQNQLGTLWRSKSAVPGTLELFDPVSCELLASEEIPGGPAVLAVLSRGVTGNGPWEISIEAADPSEGGGSVPFDSTSCSERDR